MAIFRRRKHDERGAVGDGGAGSWGPPAAGPQGERRPFGAHLERKWEDAWQRARAAEYRSR